MPGLAGNPPISLTIAAAFGAAMFTPSLGASARDEEPGDAFASAAESELEYAEPGDLPGREPGPRVRPELHATQPAAPVEPELCDWFGGKPYWDWSRATGDWGGVRTRLEDHGLTFAGSYTLEWSSVWAGGLSNRANTRSLLDLSLTLDTDAAFGLPGGTVYVDFQSSDMRGIENAGTFMSTSGLNTGDNIDQVSEVWYQQIFHDGLIRVKAGKVDAGLEFAYVTPGENFVHQSNTYLYTNSVIPTYPDPAMGACAFVYPSEQIYVGAGFFDGSLSDGVHTGRLGPEPLFDGDEYFWIAEAGVTWTSLASLGRGRLAAGGWGHTGEFERSDGSVSDGTGAGYAIVEQLLLARESAPPESDAGLVAFLLAGFADREVSDAQTQLTAGLTLNGTFEGRDDDNAGLLVTWLNLSNRRGYIENETAVELMYRLQLTPFASVKPALQYVANPGGDPTTDDAVVGVVQFELDF